MYIVDIELSEEAMVWWGLDILIQPCPQEYFPPISQGLWDTPDTRRFHRAFLAVFNKHIQAVQDIRMVWLEHANVELRTQLTEHLLEITFHIAPYLNLDEQISQAIESAKEQGLHVPYRYYRAIGQG